MRLLATLALSVLVTVAFAQTTAPVTVTKDPQAVAMMTQMMAATGWNLSSLPSDAVLSGTITRYGPSQAQTSLSLMMETTGPSQVRFSVNDGTKVTTTIINSGAGAVITPTSTSALPAHTAMCLRPTHLPFFAGLSAWADPTVSLTYNGTDIVNGQPTYRIGLRRPYASGDSMGKLIARASWLDVWISQQSTLPVQIAYEQIGTDNPNAAMVQTAQFSDFRSIGGLLVAFHEEVYAQTRHLYSLQASTIQLNVGVPATDFTIPTMQ